MSVIISRDGDAVWYQSYNANPLAAPDEARLESMVHRICSGWVDRLETSDTVAALRCRRCHLRVVVPIDVRTWGDLRTWSAQTILAKPA